MQELKDFNSNIIQSLPVDAKIVDNFPQTGFIEGNLLYNFKAIYLGGSFIYHSTGSRISYNDYSGELKYDQIVSSYSFGPIVKFKLFKEKRVNINPYISTNIIYTDFRFEETQVIFNEEISYDTKMQSAGIIFNIGLEALYKYKWTALGVFIGYSQDTFGELYLDGQKVYNESGNQIRTNWSGIRYGLNMNFEIDFNKF